MKLGTEEFNSKFDAFAHYENHYQMKPFIGKYWNDSKKMLVIGESHYLPPDLDKNLINDLIMNWYEISIDYEYIENDGKKEIGIKLYQMTDTASVVDNQSLGIFKNIDKAIRETGFNPIEGVFCYIAYMNFYQRPAENRKSINPSPYDVKMANETLKFVIDIIKPNYLFFVSSKSWSDYDKKIFNEQNVGHSAHPSRNWCYNMESPDFSKYFSKEIVTAKESFMDFIKYHKIFEDD